MRPFAFEEPETLAEVFALLDDSENGSCLMAGGSDLLGLLKDDVTYYERLVSLAGIDALRHIREEADGLHLGASLTLAKLEYEPHLQGPYRIFIRSCPERRHPGNP